jgi:hypothetical protein
LRRFAPFFRRENSTRNIALSKRQDLLIPPAVVLEPTRHVPALRIMMRPVNYAALVVRLILTVEGYRIAVAQGFDPGREINIMGDQQRTARAKLQNESLMPATVIIVRQDTDNLSLASDLLT